MNDSSEGPRDPGNEQLLPGWSSLVILLTTFGAIAVITLIALLRSAEVNAARHGDATVAHGPADFPEVVFDEPLLDSVLAASRNEEGGAFVVPPPPFSEDGIFPCSDCHADLDVNYERRDLEDFHPGSQLDHGPKERWCFDCHSAEDRDHLRLVNGTLVGFDRSYELCGQCHGTIYRDWRVGIHGRRRGFWDGAKSYLLCAHCHNPHAPKFAPMAPLPPPVRPQLLTSAKAETSETP